MGRIIRTRPPPPLPTTRQHGYRVRHGHRDVHRCPADDQCRQVGQPDLRSRDRRDVTFTFTVTNTAAEAGSTLDSLSDTDFADLTGDGDCQVGTSLAPGASCDFTHTLDHRRLRRPGSREHVHRRPSGRRRQLRPDDGHRHGHLQRRAARHQRDQDGQPDLGPRDRRLRAVHRLGHQQQHRGGHPRQPDRLRLRRPRRRGHLRHRRHDRRRRDLHLLVHQRSSAATSAAPTTRTPPPQSSATTMATATPIGHGHRRLQRRAAPISVTKTASPTSVPETGGSVTFTVTVNNLTAEIGHPDRPDRYRLRRPRRPGHVRHRRLDRRLRLLHLLVHRDGQRRLQRPGPLEHGHRHRCRQRRQHRPPPTARPP